MRAAQGQDAVTLRRHLVTIREHSVTFREHSVTFREHSVVRKSPRMLCSPGFPKLPSDERQSLQFLQISLQESLQDSLQDSLSGLPFRIPFRFPSDSLSGLPSDSLSGFPVRIPFRYPIWIAFQGSLYHYLQSLQMERRFGVLRFKFWFLIRRFCGWIPAGTTTRMRWTLTLCLTCTRTPLRPRASSCAIRPWTRPPPLGARLCWDYLSSHDGHGRNLWSCG
jgi:hypothetical protein